MTQHFLKDQNKHRTVGNYSLSSKMLTSEESLMRINLPSAAALAAALALVVLIASPAAMKKMNRLSIKKRVARAGHFGSAGA
ncbi:MAG: hypothetical protein WD063_03160 [Pirellulales bacterium]